MNTKLIRPLLGQLDYGPAPESDSEPKCWRCQSLAAQRVPGNC